MCVAPAPDFQRILEDIRTLRGAAEAKAPPRKCLLIPRKRTSVGEVLNVRLQPKAEVLNAGERNRLLRGRYVTFLTAGWYRSRLSGMDSGSASSRPERRFS
jgi:hypothetical protein